MHLSYLRQHVELVVMTDSDVQGVFAMLWFNPFLYSSALCCVSVYVLIAMRRALDHVVPVDENKANGCLIDMTVACFLAFM